MNLDRFDSGNALVVRRGFGDKGESHRVNVPGFMLPEFPPELALVIACSRWPLAESDIDEIRNRAAETVDWTKFLAWVRRNRVVPLVHRNLQRSACSLVPTDVIKKLESEFESNSFRVLTQLAEAKRILHLLADAGIRAMVLKGPTLAQIAFGNPLLRESGDVDIVVDPNQVQEADRLIVKAGYRRLVPNIEMAPALYRAYCRRRSQFGYHMEPRGVLLELHWRLTTNPLLMPFDLPTSWKRCEPIHVAGASFDTLHDDELFVYLCAHGSVHIWFRLKWLADIAAILRRRSAKTICRTAERARLLGLNRSFHQAIILAHVLMAAPVPPEILVAALADKAARRASIAACRALNWHDSPEEPINTQWFSAWVNWHAFGLRPGPHFGWKELQNQLFSPEDLARVRLPESLLFLYLPLRPLSWLIRNVRRLFKSS